jgi:hypothetical protein
VAQQQRNGRSKVGHLCWPGGWGTVCANSACCPFAVATNQGLAVGLLAWGVGCC